MAELATPKSYRLPTLVFEPLNPSSYFSRQLPPDPMASLSAALGNLPATVINAYKAGKEFKQQGAAEAQKLAATKELGVLASNPNATVTMDEAGHKTVRVAPQYEVDYREALSEKALNPVQPVPRQPAPSLYDKLNQNFSGAPAAGELSGLDLSSANVEPALPEAATTEQTPQSPLGRLDINTGRDVPAPGGKTLLIGDSMAAGLYPHLAKSGNVVPAFKVGRSVKSQITELDKSLAANPDAENVVISLGSNDYGTSYEDSLSMAQQIKDKLAGRKVTWLTPLDEKPITKAIRDVFPDAHLDGTKLGLRENFSEPDKLHLTGKGYKQWADIYSGPTTPPPATNATEEKSVSEAGGVSPALLDQIRGYEGFAPKATWDYAQYSVGYGTRAKHKGETITKEEAERRLQAEVARHAENVDNHAKKLGYSLNPRQREALISFDYNTGRSGEVLKAGGGDPEKAISRMAGYIHAGGKVLPGLVRRRKGEIEWARSKPVIESAAVTPQVSQGELSGFIPTANMTAALNDAGPAQGPAAPVGQLLGPPIPPTTGAPLANVDPMVKRPSMARLPDGTIAIADPVTNQDIGIVPMGSNTVVRPPAIPPAKAPVVDPSEEIVNKSLAELGIDSGKMSREDKFAALAKYKGNPSITTKRGIEAAKAVSDVKEGVAALQSLREIIGKSEDYNDLTRSSAAYANSPSGENDGLFARLAKTVIGSATPKGSRERAATIERVNGIIAFARGGAALSKSERELLQVARPEDDNETVQTKINAAEPFVKRRASEILKSYPDMDDDTKKLASALAGGAAEAPVAPAGTVRVIKAGKIIEIPGTNLEAAKAKGWTVAP